MINPHDPHTGAQIRFHRTDPSGRWSPIEPDDDDESGVAAFMGGVALAFLIVGLIAWGLS